MILNRLLRILSGLSVVFFICSSAFGQANFISRRDGNWSYKATWQLVSGVPASDSIPHAADNVTIKSSHDITVNVDAACNDLTINDGSKINLGASIIIGTGKSLVANGTLTWGYDASHPGYVLFADGGIATLKGTVVPTAGARLDAGYGTVVLNGSSPQALNFATFGDNSFYNLTINNSSGVAFLSSQTVKGMLTLLSGDVDMGAYTMTIDTTGSVSRTSGNIIGNLRKFVGTGGASLAFEIGDASNYTPVSVSFGSVSTAGYLTASTTAGDHPNISSSGIDATKSVNRYYTLTNSGITFDNYSATFNFVGGDVDGGANPANFVVKKYSSESWSSPAMATVTATSAQITGVTSFSDFAIGEAAVIAQLKVFLQGPFSGGSMSTALNTARVIPLSEPYNTSPWNYTGGESVTSIPSGVVDWVLVELRTGTPSSTKVATRAAFVESDGSVVDLDGTSPVGFTGVPAGNYYIVIRHRNHLAIMSASAEALSSSSSLYDFTTSQSRAYGSSPMVLVGGTSYAMYAGDGNQSGIVTATDANAVFGSLNSSGYTLNDINLSAIVTATDANIVFGDLNAATRVP
jgi:hypothetical protein